MTKLTKFINSPKMFVQDAVKKQLGLLPQNSTSIKPDKVHVKKAEPKKPIINLDVSHVNFFAPIPFIIHSGESFEAGPNQIAPWISVFEKAGVNYLILVRNEGFFNWIRATYPFICVALARRGVDVEEVIKLLPSAKYVFYPSSTGNNIHVVRFNHLQHVFIGHGDSDKASSAHKALRLYDEVWTAGEAHIDRFRNSDFDTNHIKFLKVGRPTSSKILQQCQDDWHTRMNNKVLYLPTWEGVIEETNYSSTNISGQILKHVGQDLDLPISVKFHPFTGSRNSVLKNISDIANKLYLKEGLTGSVIPQNVLASDAIVNNNIFICDISGVVSEVLTANAPIFVYIPTDRSIAISSSNMTYEDYCYTFSSVEELLEKMKIVIDGNDYLADNRKKAIDYFISYEATLNEFFISHLQEIAKGSNLTYTPKMFDEL